MLGHIECSLLNFLGWPQEFETYGKKRRECHHPTGLLKSFLWWSCVCCDPTGAGQGPGTTRSSQATHVRPQHAAAAKTKLMVNRRVREAMFRTDFCHVVPLSRFRYPSFFHRSKTSPMTRTTAGQGAVSAGWPAGADTDRPAGHCSQAPLCFCSARMLTGSLPTSC